MAGPGRPHELSTATRDDDDLPDATVVNVAEKSGHDPARRGVLVCLDRAGVQRLPSHQGNARLAVGTDAHAPRTDRG